MLQIRSQQMAAFEDAAAPNLSAEIMDFVAKTQAAARSLPAEALRERVAFGIAQARGRGVDKAPDIAIFVALMFQMGPRFHLAPNFVRLFETGSNGRSLWPSGLAETPPAAFVAENDKGDEAWCAAMAAKPPPGA